MKVQVQVHFIHTHSKVSITEEEWTVAKRAELLS